MSVLHYTTNNMTMTMIYIHVHVHVCSKNHSSMINVHVDYYTHVDCVLVATTDKLNRQWCV